MTFIRIHSRHTLCKHITLLQLDVDVGTHIERNILLYNYGTQVSIHASRKAHTILFCFSGRLRKAGH